MIFNAQRRNGRGDVVRPTEKKINTVKMNFVEEQSEKASWW